MRFDVSSESDQSHPGSLQFPFCVAPSDFPYGLELSVIEDQQLIVSIDYGQTTESKRVIEKGAYWSVTVGENSGRVFEFCTRERFGYDTFETIIHLVRSEKWLTNSSRRRRNFIFGIKLISKLFETEELIPEARQHQLA